MTDGQALGDRHSLKTTRADGNGTKDVYTLWSYNAAGLVLAKYYEQTSMTIPDSPPIGTVNHVYDPFGRLLSKSVTGGRTTSYTYNVFGELLTINYANNSGGADVTLTRDNAGLVSQAAEAYEDAAGGTAMGSGTTYYSYTAGNLASVSYSSGHTYLPNVSLSYKTRDASGRPTGYQVNDISAQRLDVGYSYDAAGRLSSVSSLHGTFTYGYHPGSGIVSGYSGVNSGTMVTQTRPVDFLNRISSVTTKNGSSQILASVAYSYDAVDRRIQARREDGTYWNYGYNDRGEVAAAQRYSAEETVDPEDAAINGLRREYDYDPIGNRTEARFGGGVSGALSQITYTPNDINQYTTITTPGKAWVTGRAPLGDTVTVNGVAAGRQDTWFSRELEVSNGTGPVKQAITVKDAASTTIASGDIEVRQESVSKLAETLKYDEAGNLEKDGRWDYKWDSENRLRKMTASDAAKTAGFPDQVVEFVYDWQGRRIAKKVTEGATVRHTRYLYEGWNVVAEWTLHGSSTTLLTPQTYLWGLDLAGQHSGDVAQLQAAGGVGGLLAVDVRKVSDASALGKLYASYDGNGNILAWSASDGTIKRSQDYDAFGNVVLRHTDSGGPLAASQGEVSYGFSTKPEEAESGLLYYGYRYYDPVTGRWPSRDLIAEKGGINLYGMISNNPVNRWDVLGLCPECPKGGRIRAKADARNTMGRLTPEQAKSTCNAQYRTKRQNGTPTSNGCGSGWNEPFVPDVGLFWDFGPACDAHDKCYGTCGITKDECDKAFQMAMRRVCADTFLWFFPSAFASCAAQAETYYQAVKRLGGSAFEDAQDEYCEWDDCCLK